MTRVGRFSLALVCVALCGAACNRGLPFYDYQREFFEITPVTGATERMVKLVNPHDDAPQHIQAIGFDGGGNQGGHFTLRGARMGGKELPLHDLSIPAGGALELRVEYRPNDLTTTVADFGGIESGQPVRYTPKKPEPRTDDGVPGGAVGAAAQLLDDTAATDDDTAEESGAEAIHRALLVVTYDHPREGVMQLELVGSAIPGPNGELSAPVGGGSGGGGGAGESTCAAGGQTACFAGDFAIELPGIMQGAVAVELASPWAITLDGASATVDMAQFPVALIVVEGNGPGEPLEGKPISALSIAISGDDESTATGSFDGSNLELTGVGFRIRIYLSKISLADVGTTTTTVDFRVTNLTIITAAPFQDGTITLEATTTLGPSPSGNQLVDPFLAGANVVVRMTGTLELP